MKTKVLASNFIFAASLFFVCFYVAWQINASSNFLYSSWYEVLALDDAIEKYAPQNKYRKGFENTNKQQHVNLFTGIVNAIQNKGEGLAQLEYLDNKSNKKHLLLTLDEIVHLKDVANLVNKFKYIGSSGLLLAIFVFFYMRWRNIKILELHKLLLGGLSLIFILIIMVLVVGPTKIFYWAHEMIFPDDHPWFFYYEDSLMSTMMKAPALFGPIACQLLLLTLFLWCLMLFLIRSKCCKESS